MSTVQAPRHGPGPFESSQVYQWHHEDCGLPFEQFRNTNWRQCPAGHVYWSDGTSWWVRAEMRGHDT